MASSAPSSPVLEDTLPLDFAPPMGGVSSATSGGIDFTTAAPPAPLNRDETAFAQTAAEAATAVESAHAAVDEADVEEEEEATGENQGTSDNPTHN